MRRRLVLGVVAVVLVTGLLIGIPLAVWSAVGIRDRATSDAQASAQRTVDILVLRESTGAPNTREELAPYFTRSRLVTITYPDGQVEVFGTPPTGDQIQVSSEAEGYRVEIVEPTGNVASLWVVGGRILLITAIAMAVTFVIARRRARNLGDMFDRLANDARRIGSGDTRPVGRYGLEELDEIADALDVSAKRVNEVVKAERTFVSDVTHQMRTPLTAISLRLDEVNEAGNLDEARAEAAAAQEQVSRLTGVIDELLFAARHREVAVEPVSLDTVLTQQHLEWTPVFEALGRRLSMPTMTGLVVMGTKGALSQVLATLLENAVEHGAGEVRVGVRQTSGTTVIEVSDEGPGVDPRLGSRIFERAISGGGGSGLGLSLARALSEHMGGRLELTCGAPAVFALFLVSVDPDETEAAVVQEGPMTSGVEPASASTAVSPLSTDPLPAAAPVSVRVPSMEETSPVTAAAAGNTQRR